MTRSLSSTGGALGFAVEQAEGRIVVPIGEDVLELLGVRDGSHPFHHFALLVPGDCFDAAHAWIGKRTDRLIHEGDSVVAFDFWDARATYFHDPAGNIVELIAHAGVAKRPGAGADFSADDLAGFSEVAIVVDRPADAVDALARVGLELWSGDAEQFAFVGEKARTLIISPPQRGWLPTGRPAEAYAATVTVATGGAGDEEILLASGPERRVRRTGPTASATVEPELTPDGSRRR